MINSWGIALGVLVGVGIGIGIGFLYCTPFSHGMAYYKPFAKKIRLFNENCPSNRANQILDPPIKT